MCDDRGFIQLFSVNILFPSSSVLFDCFVISVLLSFEVYVSMHVAFVYCYVHITPRTEACSIRLLLHIYHTYRYQYV